MKKSANNDASELETRNASAVGIGTDPSRAVDEMKDRDDDDDDDDNDDKGHLNGSISM